MIPNDEERERVLDVMAFKLQHPRIKINYAILHGGTQGCGKDTMWAPFLWSVCGPSLLNLGHMDNDTLSSAWGYQLEAEVIMINELRADEAKDRRAVANRLKPIIAAPPMTLPINRKGLHPYNAVNRAFVLSFSNDPVPIVLDSKDRRWMCVWSGASRLSARKATQLWKFYAAGGYAKVGGWLASRDVSAFNPSGMPIWTDYKASMIEQGMSDGEAYLLGTIKGRVGEFASGLIAAPFQGLIDRLRGVAPPQTKLHQAMLHHALIEAGWVDMGRLACTEHHNKRQLWAAPEIAEAHTKSELRRMVELPQVNTMTAALKLVRNRAG
jgi:hypothetical protein